MQSNTATKNKIRERKQLLKELQTETDLTLNRAESISYVIRQFEALEVPTIFQILIICKFYAIYNNMQ